MHKTLPRNCRLTKGFELSLAKVKTGDSESGWIEGYLAVFGNIDLGNERIVKGAFQKSITENGAKGWPLMSRHMVYGGDAPDVIGTITEAKEDEYGLFVHAEFASDDASQAMRQKIADGHVSGLSVGYRLIRYEPEEIGEKTIYNLKECALEEGTVTVRPMNPLAQITTAKSDQGDGFTLLAAQLSTITERLNALEAKVTGNAEAGKTNPTSAAPADHNDDELQQMIRENTMFIERMKSL